jgi:HlyD family type I secretion membrane fusion protein
MSTITLRPDDPSALPALLRRWRLRGLVAVALWLAALSAWLVWAPISGAVVGYGAVKVDSDRQAVTHRDGGIVAQVLVREGQVVSQGQTLIVLEDARVDASVELLQTQLDGERLRESRLAAEAALRATWAPDRNGSVAAAARRAPEALARERATFAARRSTFDGQLAAVRGQLADTETEIAAHQRNTVASAEGAGLMSAEVASNEALLKENFVNQARVDTLRRGLAEYGSRLATIEADLAQARQRKAELDGRLLNLRLAYVQAATDDLRETAARAADLEARLRAGRDTAGRQRVMAPVAGRLVGLRVNTVGSAIGPRDPIVDIVPSGVALLVEAKLAPDAVTDIRPGQAAEIRLLGFGYRQVGLLDGRVVNVSPDSLVDPRSGATYFAVLVEPDAAALARFDRDSITPGMAAEVFVKTSERSTLQFLLEPLTAGMRRGFREH